MKLSKQERQHLYNLIDSITDTSEKYCYKCAKEHNKLILSSDCKEHDQYFTIAYCPVHKHMQVYRFSKCARCTFGHNGLRVSYCSKCKKDTMHNGTICTVCYPMDIGSRMKYCPICQKVTQHFGKRCAICTGVKNGMRIVYCPVCNKNTKHNGTICTICNNMKIGFRRKYCTICKKETLHFGNKCSVCAGIKVGLFMSYCPKCGKITKHNGKVCTICNNMKIGAHYAYCNVCEKETLFNGGVCTKCHPESFARPKVSYCPICKRETGHIGKLCLICHPTNKPFFTEKYGKRYYKGIEVHQLADDIMSGKIDIKDYPGFNIRYGSVHFHTIDIITGSHDSLIRELQYKDNKLYYNGQLWEQYKKDFISSSKRIPIYNGFWLDTSSNFEQQLIDKNIKWFTYIKFYYKNNKIYPLVVGKTGSKLVNSSGTDIAFKYDYDTKHPGRRLLAEEGLKWVEDKVYIIPTKDEASAYRKECIIATKYNLFMS